MFPEQFVQRRMPLSADKVPRLVMPKSVTALCASGLLEARLAYLIHCVDVKKELCWSGVQEYVCPASDGVDRRVFPSPETVSVQEEVERFPVVVD